MFLDELGKPSKADGDRCSIFTLRSNDDSRLIRGITEEGASLRFAFNEALVIVCLQRFECMVFGVVALNEDSTGFFASSGAPCDLS